MWLLLKKSWFFVLLVVLIPTEKSCYGQGLPELRHCTISDFTMDFYVLSSPKKINYKDTLHYFWFKAQKLHETQGEASGNILHGSFSKYYVDGQLAEKGDFKLGLKDGDWLTWYASGNLKSSCQYRKGLRQGNFMAYDENGLVVLNQRYKKGKVKPSRSEIKAYKNQEKVSKDSLNSVEIEDALNEPAESDSTWFERHFKRSKPNGDQEELDEEKTSWFKRLFKAKNKNTETDSEKEAEKAEKQREKEARRAIKKAEKEIE